MYLDFADFSRSLFHKPFLFKRLCELVTNVQKKNTASSNLSDIVLLVVLILGLSFLYRFTIGRTNSDLSSNSKLVNNTEPLIIKPQKIENRSLEDAIKDLTAENCRLVILKAKAYLNTPHVVDYDEFKSKALKSKIVFLSPSDSGLFLLVQINNEQWVWIPS